MDANFESTPDRLLSVAAQIFQEKGLAGARMQEIADKAGINKAMLHYYFKTKEDLFNQVFNQALAVFIEKIGQILASELPLPEKVDQYINHTIDSLTTNPTMPSFVLYELNREPQRITAIFAGDNRIDLTRFRRHFQLTSQANQFFTDMVSLCVYPFVARPMLERLLSMTNDGYEKFLQQRKKHIKKLLLESI